MKTAALYRLILFHCVRNGAESITTGNIACSINQNWTELCSCEQEPVTQKQFRTKSDFSGWLRSSHSPNVVGEIFLHVSGLAGCEADNRGAQPRISYYNWCQLALLAIAENHSQKLSNLCDEESLNLPNCHCTFLSIANNKVFDVQTMSSA